MLLVCMVVCLGTDVFENELGISLQKQDTRMLLRIESHTLTANLRKTLLLDCEQTRAVNRIVLELSARAEASECSERPAFGNDDLLRRMDRSIEKHLTTRQRVLYRDFKRERSRVLTQQS